MAQAKSAARAKAEEKAALRGIEITNWNDPIVKTLSAVRDIDRIMIEVGAKFTIPTDYKVFVNDFNGTKYLVVISEEGAEIPLGTLTRSARRVSDGQRVKPQGTAVTECQKYVSIQQFLDKAKGKKLFYKAVEEVATEYNGVASTAKVWTIDLVA